MQSVCKLTNRFIIVTATTTAIIMTVTITMINNVVITGTTPTPISPWPVISTYSSGSAFSGKYIHLIYTFQFDHLY